VGTTRWGSGKQGEWRRHPPGALRCSALAGPWLSRRNLHALACKLGVRGDSSRRRRCGGGSKLQLAGGGGGGHQGRRGRNILRLGGGGGGGRRVCGGHRRCRGRRW
jgi:hypothetical protein